MSSRVGSLRFLDQRATACAVRLLAIILLVAAPLTVRAQDAAAPTVEGDRVVRIIQTNAAGDRVHLIDPALQRVVDVIPGIPIAHGVTSHPDGHALYFSNEVDHTLDVVPARTMRVSEQIPLTGRPNNVAITPDGEKVYVAITGGDAFVDVIDLSAGRVVKSIPTAGGVHNVYVTPDGRHAVAGMIGARTLTVIDTETDEPLWSMEFDGGVRPMTFDRNPDGSTRHVFVQISGFHGVYVVDFATRSVVERLTMPDLPPSRQDNDALQGSPGHGLAVAPDGGTLWSTSKPNSHVYAWSLPDLRFLGGVEVGHHPDWLTMTPDGRYLYSANAGSNDVSVVDTREMREVLRIPVGQVPKRNHTAILDVAPRPAAAAGGEGLSFERYRSEIEPIFLVDRGGHGPSRSACASCHAHNGTPLHLQPLDERGDGTAYWSEEKSRLNFEVVRRLVTPGDPGSSRLLRKPLSPRAGGADFHVGGRFWQDTNDPEWRTIASWVRDADPAATPAPDPAPELDFDFFRSCVQRVFFDKRDGRMECVHCHGGGSRGFARPPADGRSWSLDEARQTFEVLARYIEPGHPDMSRFLMHPLAPHAGGDNYHSGGRRWMSRDDPEWRMLADWVRGQTPQCVVQ